MESSPLTDILLPSCSTYPLSFLGASHMLDNPCLHDQQNKKKYKTNSQAWIPSFGDTHITCVDFHEFDIFDTMVSHLDLANLELLTTNNCKNMGIYIYNVLSCDIGYTILLHGFIFLSLYLVIGSSDSLVMIGSDSYQLQFRKLEKLPASLQYPVPLFMSQTSTASMTFGYVILMLQ